MTAASEWEATPFFREFGVTVADVEPGFARLAVPHASVLVRGAREGINGGVIAGLAEAAMHVCLDAMLTEGERAGSTRELSVAYLSAARGAVTHVEARMVRKGRRLAVGTVEVHDAEAGTACSIVQISCAVLPARERAAGGR
ncbi:MAG: PaaI family thioesterase [Chloroflexi bacterium]|nr:PaaI family thioesterase [Chloroflexota bacterium]